MKKKIIIKVGVILVFYVEILNVVKFIFEKKGIILNIVEFIDYV